MSAENTVSQGSFLKKPLVALLVLALGVLGSVARFYELDLRPLHHDEGVNHLFIQETDRDGFYHYSHENYHGPTFFYVTWATWKIFGDTELGMRGGVGLVGVLTFLFLPWFWIKDRLWTGVFAGLLIAFSPAHLYYNRYSIHETLFVGFTVLLAFTAYRWLLTPKISQGVVGGIALGLLAATKETYIIALAAIFFGLLCVAPRKFFVKEEYRDRASSVCLGLFIGVVILFFIVSAAFTWTQGIGEVAMSIPQWIGRNSSDNGHFKPASYYLMLIWKNEWEILFLGLSSIFILPFCWMKKEFSRGRFLWGWGLASLAIYSALNYKMPWIFLNISMPLILAGVETISFVPQRIITYVLFVIALGLGGYKAYQTNFINPYGDPENPFAYVHTLQGEKTLIQDIKDYIDKREKRPIKILVGVDGYWPLPFYFKQLENQGYKFTLAYELFNDVIKADRQPFKEFDVVMAEESYDGSAGPFNLEKVRGYEDVPTTKEKQWSETYYRLADHEDSKVYYRLMK